MSGARDQPGSGPELTERQEHLVFRAACEFVLAGVALSLVGVWRAFARPCGLPGKLFGPLGAVFSLALAGLFGWYVFSLSYGLPGPTQDSLSMIRAPEFSLSDHAGKTVRSQELRGKKIVLTFYRGYW